MNLPGIGLTSFAVALFGALVPGPLLAITVERSLREGFRAGPELVLGHGLLEFLLVVVLIAGLGEFLKATQVVTVLGIAGGIVLMILGTGMVQTAKTFVPRQVVLRKGLSGLPTVLAGALVSLANPYWTLWWASIGLVYLGMALAHGFRGVAVFFLGHFSADFFWYSLVSFSLSRPSQLLSGKAFRLVMVFCGLFLVGLGLWFLSRGIVSLRLLVFLQCRQ